MRNAVLRINHRTLRNYVVELVDSVSCFFFLIFKSVRAIVIFTMVNTHKSK
jgi:hypothetical protein